jgi:hypothetical protein
LGIVPVKFYEAEVTDMNVFEMIRDAVQFLSDGVTRIFKPSDDHYPETGVQPFEGEPFSEWVELQNVKDSSK